MSKFEVSETVKTPWLKNRGVIPATLDYYDGTMWEKCENVCNSYPDFIAYDFMGGKTKYKEFKGQVEECAKALKAIGIKEDDKVTVCLPNCPQAVIMFYAINLVGAISNMIHPLSSENEIAFFLNESESVAAITLDQFYGKFAAIQDQIHIKTLIISSIKDVLSPVMKVGYALTSGRKIPRLPKNAPVLLWKDFIDGGRNYDGEYRAKKTKDDAAVILYSGGTTGTTKGILLSNNNFNALSTQILAANPMAKAGDKVLSVMPVFHGFGLGISIHTFLAFGGCCILVPRFTPESYAKLLIKHKCNFVAGVPTLFEALLRQKSMKNADLSFLKGVFSGGDSLSIELKKKLDKFLSDHHSPVPVREGYGTTECVTASCLTPMHMAKEGSIGIPLPDMYYKIVSPGTQNEVPYGEEGEICIAGPTVMMEYLHHPDETAQTLRQHKDGMTWVHTGDLGLMDEDGFVFFRQRIKRMIITSGYNVYPSQLENIIDAHELVQMSCVIGVPDPYRIQKVKAFIMLKAGVEKSEENKQAIIEYCKKNIAKYAIPRDIEFRDQLPKTLVGKVAYRQLEEEELAKESADKTTSNV